MPEPGKFLGKYRGKVLINVDPEQRGRIIVEVPDVLGDVPSSWAMPCVPLAGAQMGHYVVPVVGAGVWVEFEQGDPSYPIWVGCWWGSVAEVPALALSGPPQAPNILLQTNGQHTMVMSDLPGGPGITLKTPSGASLIISDQGILLNNGKGASITLVGNTVTVNQGALVVT
jgi:uncharacterized protein involved in type VI secretion and phage assembly